MCPNLKLYYRAIVVQTVWFWNNNRYIALWNRTTSPETNPCIYDQLIYDKGAKNIQWERTVSSINGVGKTGQPHAKEWNCTIILHHTQKLTQNGLKTWIDGSSERCTND